MLLGSRLAPRRSTSVVLILLASCIAPRAAAIPVEPLLPLSAELIQQSNVSVGGIAPCETSGSYDATTFVWNQVGICGVAFGPDGRSIEYWQANLAALVDNSGRLLGGTFALLALMPAYGIDELSLVASGTLLGAYYGEEPHHARDVLALVDLSYAVEPIASFGSVLLWEANTAIGGFGFCTSSGPPEECTAWQVSSTYSGNYTGSVYWFFDRSVVISEGNSAILLSAGLLILAAARRRIRERAGGLARTSVRPPISVSQAW